MDYRFDSVKGMDVMYGEDFLMRQIEGMSRMLAKLVFDKETSGVEIVSEEGVIFSEDFLLHRLIGLIEHGEINKAENILFEELQRNNSQTMLGTALQFYEKLSENSDEYLLSCNYSREEILDGLTRIKQMCDAETLD